MYKILRIISCIVAVALTAACPFVFLYAGNTPGIICIGAILVCFFAMLTFKKFQEDKEGIKDEKPLVGDYITGKVPLPKNDETEKESVDDASHQS